MITSNPARPHANGLVPVKGAGIAVPAAVWYQGATARPFNCNPVLSKGPLRGLIRGSLP